MDILKAIHSVKTYDEFLAQLRDHEASTGTKYVLIASKKSFSNENVKLSKDCKLHWQHNVPFFHFGTRIFSCHQGKDTNLYKKKKYAQQRDSKVAEGLTKRYNKTQLTKKLNCPATVYVTRVIRMPEFKISGEITHSRKNHTSLRIKKKMSEFAQIGEECYIFNLPEVDDHKFHFVGSTADSRQPEQQNNLDKNSIEQPEPEQQDNVDKNSIEQPEPEQQNNLGKNSIEQPDSRHLLNECNSTIASIQSMMLILDENKLDELSRTLKEIFQNLSSHVTNAKFTSIPVQPKKVKGRKSLTSHNGKLSPKKKKSLRRVRLKEDVLRTASIINVYEVPPVLQNEIEIYTISST